MITRYFIVYPIMTDKYPTATEMSMAWAADHPAIIGSIKIYKEPSW